MSEKKPQPLVPDRGSNRCPICGEKSYSKAGIHPQCSVKQEDERRKSRLKQEESTTNDKKDSSKSKGRTAWQKSCPKCNAIQHVRKKACECGFRFETASPPRSDVEA